MKHPVAVACCAQRLLGRQDLARYMIRLGDSKKHEEYLVEFLPALRFKDAVEADFEFKTGAGDRDVDWRFRRYGHVPVLVVVKHRIADFIDLAERMQKGEQRPNGHAPQPQHDGTMLFRSVEKKFARADPDVHRKDGACARTSLTPAPSGGCRYGEPRNRPERRGAP